MRDFEKPNRSLVVSTEAMAATSHPSATLAAIRILAAGGNALDAAIAACAVQCVVEPGSTGVGGDCFALIAPDGSSDIIAYNGSGRAPAGASAAWCLERGLAEIPRQSPISVTVPGAVDAWARLHADHGRMSWAEILAPAIRFAEQGYAISPRVSADWALDAEALAGDPNARRIFLPDGRAPRVGEIHRQPELAGTLRSIAVQGRDGFYTGAVAEDIVAYLQSLDGPHTLEDFANARGEYVAPISTSFRDHEVYECPPNGQGIVALIILNILSRFPASGDPLSVDRLHLEIEAARLAYAARDEMVADPSKADVPVDYLLSDALADRLAGMIDPRRALVLPPTLAETPGRDTVYLCVVDRDRMTVSFINSLYDGFGSGLAAPRSGVVLQNRGQCFTLEPGHPNQLAGGKRPLHTIIPGMLAREGRAVMPFGVMGGHYQPMGHAHLLSKALDFGFDPQRAIELPRLYPVPGRDVVEAERTFDPATLDALRGRGFRIEPAADPLGGAQAIQIDWENGTLLGGSESRKDGCALGL